MTDYPGGGSSDPLLEPLEGLSEDAESIQADLLRSYFRAIAGQTGADVTQGISDALARLDNLRATLQDYADNDIVPTYGALPPPSAEASVPASPNEAGFELLTFDVTIRNDAKWMSRGTYRTLRGAWLYVSGSGLEVFGAILWDGELFEVFAPDTTENL